MNVHPYSSNSDIYNALFHPLHKKENKTLAIVTNVALTIITGFLWQIPFWILNRIDNRKVVQWKASSKDNKKANKTKNSTLSLTAEEFKKQSENNPAKKDNHTLKQWQERYHQIVEKNGSNFSIMRNALQSHRISLYKETKRLCLQGYYYIVDQKREFDKEATQRMIEGTISYSLQPQQPQGNVQHHTIYEVLEADTFELGEQYKQDCNPVALNMANAFNPGGGVEQGCGAQEESLFRRSNYFQALYPKKETLYPIPDQNVIYTPEVQIFRTPETYLNSEIRQPGYEFREIGSLDMIACAFPDLRGSSIPIGYEEDIRNRVRNILRVASIKGHDALVLGAIGCGAFANDPRNVARVFGEELRSNEFRGRFKKIGFAIIYPEVVYNGEKLNLIDIFQREIHS